jgi:hypothetical protein
MDDSIHLIKYRYLSKQGSDYAVDNWLVFGAAGSMSARRTIEKSDYSSQ